MLGLNVVMLQVMGRSQMVELLFIEADYSREYQTDATPSKPQPTFGLYTIDDARKSLERSERAIVSREKNDFETLPALAPSKSYIL